MNIISTRCDPDCILTDSASQTQPHRHNLTDTTSQTLPTQYLIYLIILLSVNIQHVNIEHVYKLLISIIQPRQLQINSHNYPNMIFSVTGEEVIPGWCG